VGGGVETSGAGAKASRAAASTTSDGLVREEERQ
jgi:hypothetical protein